VSLTRRSQRLPVALALELAGTVQEARPLCVAFEAACKEVFRAGAKMPLLTIKESDYPTRDAFEEAVRDGHDVAELVVILEGPPLGLERR